jgi:hypothetical protein
MAMNMDAMLRIKADVQGENNIRRLGNSMQGLQGQAKNAAMGFTALKGAVVGLGAAIAGSAIVAGFGAMVKNTIDLGDELGKLSARTGVAQNALIGLQNAAKLSDVSNESLAKSLTKLNVNLVKAAEGNDKLASRFKQLGVNVKGADGQVVSADRAMKQLADRFKDMPDGAQKAAAAVDIFGKSGADLIPLLNSGSEAMEKFTYKVSDDFSARSELFNDTITELGFKTQGFQMQLTDALLPALQSILEVFGDLFNTESDWTALFEVIKGGLRAVATVIYATIKLVDALIKNISAGFEAVSLAVQGDFGGAMDVITGRLAAYREEAEESFRAIQKMWTDAPSPGVSGRRGGSALSLMTDDTDARKAAKDAERSAAKAARDAAREAERAQRDYNRALEGAAGLAEDLKRKTRDLKLDTVALGATGKEAIDLQYKAAMNAAGDEAEDLAQKVFELIKLTGGSVRFEGLRGIARDYLEARTNQIEVRRQEQLAELAKQQDQAMGRLRRQAGGLTRDQERRLTIEERLAQIATEMPDLYAAQKDEIDKLVAASAGLTEQQERNKEIVEGIAQSIGSALSASLSLIIDGTKDWASSLREIASNLLRSIADQLLQIMVIAPIIKAITGAFGFANGGIMSGDGPMPLKTYARGGIANSPQMALFGEGSMPEAYVPLPDGRRIPVAMQGGGGGSNVTVNVDARGTEVQGNGGRGEQLARAIAQAVQNELIKQKRPGGLLTAA